MRRKGFSLVELLVVISIIGLLVSMTAMPIYSRTVAIARRTSCANNLNHLMTLLRATRQGQRERGEWTTGQPPFVRTSQWPGTVAFEGGSRGVFMCPEDESGAGGGGHPPLMYKSAISLKFIPFDPSHYSACWREGVTDKGRSYVEYCIEENPNPPWKAKWSHADIGHPEYSTNDGIWRVYEEWQAGRRKVVLIFYTCGSLNNEIWIEGEFYADKLGSRVPMTFYFDDAVTSYGYNVDLEDDFEVGTDTIVLLDYPRAHVDGRDTEKIYPDLNSTGSSRHLGKHNVLYVSGAVKTVGTASLYPDINMGQWTADPLD